MTDEDVWQLPESLLVMYLRRANAGEDPDMLMLEMEANADHVDCGDDEED